MAITTKPYPSIELKKGPDTTKFILNGETPLARNSISNFRTLYRNPFSGGLPEEGERPYKKLKTCEGYVKRFFDPQSVNHPTPPSLESRGWTQRSQGYAKYYPIALKEYLESIRSDQDLRMLVTEEGIEQNMRRISDLQELIEKLIAPHLKTLPSLTYNTRSIPLNKRIMQSLVKEKQHLQKFFIDRVKRNNQQVFSNMNLLNKLFRNDMLTPEQVKKWGKLT